MIIAVASGKGGVGKTTVAVNLAVLLQDKFARVALLDCDVEEPNTQLFLKPAWELEKPEHMTVPLIDEAVCQGEECRRCVALCRFKSLIFMAGSVMVFPELCHGCGLCALACPVGAVRDGRRELGLTRIGSAGRTRLYGGLLRVGEAMASPLIRAVKRLAEEEPVQIWDCPPGTACPTIVALSGADFVVLVAEPTAFGLHDLKLAAALVRSMGLPFGVVVNRVGLGDDRVERWLSEERIPLLASIPNDPDMAAAASEGRLLIREFPEFESALKTLWSSMCWRSVREAS